MGADGKPRELHVEKACEVTQLTPPVRPTKPMGEKIQKDGYSTTLLATSEYFNVNKLEISEKAGIDVTDDSFVSLLCLDGSFKVNDITLDKGESCFIPAGYGKVEISGNGEIIATDLV